MTRAKLMIALGIVVAPTAAPAAYLGDQGIFATPSVCHTVLAGVHGTGDGFAADLHLLTSERARSDERTFAAVGSVSMDAWWADIGIELIAASVTR